VADWKKVVVGADTEGVKVAAAANTRLSIPKSAVVDIGKTAVACPMVVRRIRVDIVDIGHSGYEGTVHCLAQRAALALRALSN